MSRPSRKIGVTSNENDAEDILQKCLGLYTCKRSVLLVFLSYSELYNARL